jgi:hypothetical protein
LIQIGLADDNCTGALEAPNRLSIFFGLVRESRTGSGRRHARDVDVVLHHYRHAIQAAFVVQHSGLGDSFVLVAERDENAGVAERLDACVAAPDSLRGRHNTLCPPRSELAAGGRVQPNN